MYDSTIVNGHTPRQWRLYEYYKKEFEKDPTKWLQSKDIYVDMHLNDFDDYPSLLPNVDWNNQTARRQITEDILALKESKTIQNIILSDHRGSKIATKEEAAPSLFSERMSLLASLGRNWFQIKKIGLDGQFRFVFQKEKNIIEVFRKHPEIERTS